MAKSKSVTVPKGSGDTAVDVIKTYQAKLAAAESEAATLRTQVEALGHDVIRVRQFADQGRHEQVQAYREACGFAVAALSAIVSHTTSHGVIDPEQDAALIDRARAAIAAAKELP